MKDLIKQYGTETSANEQKIHIRAGSIYRLFGQNGEQDDGHETASVTDLSRFRGGVLMGNALYLTIRTKGFVMPLYKSDEP